MSQFGSYTDFIKSNKKNIKQSKYRQRCFNKYRHKAKMLFFNIDKLNLSDSDKNKLKQEIKYILR